MDYKCEHCTQILKSSSRTTIWRHSKVCVPIVQASISEVEFSNILYSSI